MDLVVYLVNVGAFVERSNYCIEIARLAGGGAASCAANDLDAAAVVEERSGGCGPRDLRRWISAFATVLLLIS